MNLDDRFADNQCVTCGVEVEDDYIKRHHDWHNELERFMEVIKDSLPNIPRGLYNWD